MPPVWGLCWRTPAKPVVPGWSSCSLRCGSGGLPRLDMRQINACITDAVLIARSNGPSTARDQPSLSLDAVQVDTINAELDRVLAEKAALHKEAQQLRQELRDAQQQLDQLQRHSTAADWRAAELDRLDEEVGQWKPAWERTIAEVPCKLPMLKVYNCLQSSMHATETAERL